MSAVRIMSFTTALHLTRDRVNLLVKQNRRCALATTAQTRIRCCKPTSTGVDDVARKQQQQQAHADTPHSRPVAPMAASMATDEDAYMTQNTTKRATKLLGDIHAESEWGVYCDVLPDSSVCRHLAPSCLISYLEEEPGCEFECVGRGSKKPQRLSSTSWDLLD